jgi:predicted RNase H-like HicB family nuclease
MNYGFNYCKNNKALLSKVHIIKCFFEGSVFSSFYFKIVERRSLSCRPISKENKRFVASCPLLEIATQGKTEAEVKENMTDLINDYLSDANTPKQSFEDLMSLSLSNIPVNVPRAKDRWF